jgi:GNAT superfamily N-acetyltransferase
MLRDRRPTRVETTSGVGHRDDISSVFRSTFALGTGTGRLAVADAYEAFALGWFLDRLDDAVVAVRDGQVVGYALLCPDPASLEQWTNRAARRLARRAAALGVRGRLTRRDALFLFLRLRDALSLSRTRRGSHPNNGLHPEVHLNVVEGHRGGGAALALLDAVDRLAEARGVTQWWGEINAEKGRRSRALERVVGEVVASSPNRTFSWMCGIPIERLTVRRTVGVASGNRRQREHDDFAMTG